jgi:hypothetical protein
LIPAVKGKSTAISWIKPPTILNYNIVGVYSLKDILFSELCSAEFMLYNSFIYYHLPWVRMLSKLLFLFLFLWGVYIWNYNRKRESFREIHYLLFGYFMFYIISNFLISIYLQPLFLPRYLIPILPIYLIILAKGVDNLKLNFLKYMAIFSISGLSLISISTYFTDETFKKAEYGKASCYIQENEREGDIICLNSNYIGLTFNYYYKGSLEKRYFTSNLKQRDGLIKELSKEYDRLWLVSSEKTFINEDIDEYIEKKYNNLLKRIMEKKFKDVKIILYKFNKKG